MSFKNKVVIVTGASSGIGAATAVALSKQGADVVIVARNQAKLDNVKADCEKVGKTPLVVNADVTEDASAKSVIDRTIQTYGKIDVLINNAGRSYSDPFGSKTNMQSFDEMMSLNLRALVYLTHLAAPHLIETKGYVVNVSSIAATKTWRNCWAYCTAKAGVDHFSRCIASELAPKGVRVNTVNPGPVNTDLFENSKNMASGESMLSAIKESTPLKRYSESEEIADVILFLASEKAKGVTGSNWVSDNGSLLV